MPLLTIHRPQLSHGLGALSFFVACLSACGDDGGAGDGTTSTGTGTGGGPFTASGGGGGACVDNQEGNDHPDTAHAMTFPAGGGQLAFQGKVCPSQSDYFELQAACAGFVRAELHCKDEQGGADSVCDQGELELHLWHDTGETLVPRLVSASAYAKEVVHAPVEQGRWILEVRHASGSTTDYTLSVTSLPSGYCLSTAWICEADEQAIEATEASCEVLPSGSSCPSSDVYTQPVDLPRVFDGSSGWTPGFAVFAFPHEVRNPHTPTPSELTLLESRCIEACETHWANTPEVTATCNGSSFTDIVLRDMPSIPSRALIPTELEDGSDLFPAQGGLAYGLHDASVERTELYLVLTFA